MSFCVGVLENLDTIEKIWFLFLFMLPKRKRETKGFINFAYNLMSCFN